MPFTVLKMGLQGVYTENMESHPLKSEGSFYSELVVVSLRYPALFFPIVSRNLVQLQKMLFDTLCACELSHQEIGAKIYLYYGKHLYSQVNKYRLGCTAAVHDM